MRSTGILNLPRLDNEIHSLLNDILSGPFFRSPVTGFPAVNLWESGDEYHLEAELPGIRLEDLEITVQGNELTINGSRRTEGPGANSGRADKPDTANTPAEPASDEQRVVYHRRERGAGEFRKVLQLPTDVDADRVAASLVNGVLRLTLPKAAHARPRRIAINSH